MQNRQIRFGPVALTVTLTTNILNPAITSLSGPIGYVQTQPYLLVKHIRIVNKTGSAATVSLWIGATGGNVAGTEFAYQGTSVAANSYVDWYGLVRFDSGDFLVGGSGTATALTFEAEGEIGMAG
jgi:hypothetical protein